MSSKVKISFVLPEGLQKDLRERIVLDGYSLKGKSQWVAEAVEQLFQLDDFMDLVKVNDVMQGGFEKFESVLIDRKLKMQLDESVIQVRRKYPEIDGVQSRIMRTAILQRLL
ncbi:hypothetical protein [Aquicella lusitana]|uniref:Uncharacterized protein n=1 Tax=Aquicella lusitana TaxID=254246 RepID=A0A370GGL1_9COXI|nr:hypothetical protein [Aquicella lusitana]RDI41103.1 hypothetical protein C8D86_1211 [Aquicella lusitana]VVC74713.1 hypothetical protein AQULUS_24790 [Aquicella lusitana]